MDTPERNQIGTPVSKFEDSPVFSYINNLSPIKPFRSHSTQIFQPLSFASISSVFTSPHISSVEKSRFLRRNNLLDSCKAVFSADDGDEGKTCSGLPSAVQLPDCSSESQEKCDMSSSTGEANVEPCDDDHVDLAVKLSRTLKYDCVSPNSKGTLCHAVETDTDIEIVETPGLLVHFVRGSSPEKQSAIETDVKLQEVCQFEQAKDEVAGCDWENLMSDAADLLIFDASSTPEACRVQNQKLVEHETVNFSVHGTELHAEGVDDPQKRLANQHHASSNIHHQQESAFQLGGIGEQNKADNRQSLLPCTSKNNHDGDLGEQIGKHVGDSDPSSKVDGQQQRGMRRRCLVFEAAGTQNKNFEDDSRSTSSTSSQADGKINTDDKQLPPLRASGTSSSSCIVPGIGLHLNTLASTSKSCKVIKQEIIASGRRLISIPKPVGSFSSLSTVQRAPIKCLALNPVDREIGPVNKNSHFTQDSLRVPGIGVGEDSNPSSPKKKRRRVETVGEPEACKRCNCKKSKCLKLYCECFAAGVYCVEPCSCQDCYNKPIHEDTVLATRKQIESRNPLAFAPKVIRSSESLPDVGEEYNKTPASARHKRGCNCKKSSCNKKYCECYQGGVGCSSNCRCEGCKNAFGRKDGAIVIGMEEVEHEEEAEALEKNGSNQNLQHTEVSKDESHYSDSHLPITPFSLCRASIKLRSFSSGKPPRSSVLPTGSVRKSDLLTSEMKFEKHFQINPENETPEVLRADSSPVSGVKNASPNSKRVSPPHNGLGLGFSPGRRSSRKLILQSIPSLPALTPLRETTKDFPLKF
ncbi:protein tesmin/TSO1-like CXC 2 [Aristolochia californica]|uniref:protein tesmin/TSO1-like CXC 2 n=1 Tax=Aristolochia californica TaxID=171875 RepID=UPI0035DD62B6